MQTKIWFSYMIFLKVTSAKRQSFLKIYHLVRRSKYSLFCRKVMFCYQGIQGFFLLSHDLSNLWRHGEYWYMRPSAFWIYLLNRNSFSQQTWPTDRYKQGQLRSEIFWKIWRAESKFQVIFTLPTCSNDSWTSFTSYKIPMFYFSEKVKRSHYNW